MNSNFCFGVRISLRWPVHINPVDKTKLSCNTPRRRSATVPLETYPLYLPIRPLSQSQTVVKPKPK